MAKPTVFLSAVTVDLGSDRLARMAATIHNDFACVCRYRDNLVRGDALLVEKLRDEIAEADFILHFVGPSYGFDPMLPATGPRPSDQLWQPACGSWWPGTALPARRSYTQMELDFALALKKRVYVFFIDDPEVVAAAAAQSEENARLQSAHREAIKQRGHEYVKIDSVSDLDKFVTKVPVVASHLKAMVASRDEALGKAADVAREEGGKNRRLILAVVTLVLLVGCGVGWLVREQHRQTARIEDLYGKATPPMAPGEVSSSGVDSDSSMRPAEVPRLVRLIPGDPATRARVLFLEGNYAEAEKMALKSGASSPDGFIIAGDVRLRQMRYPAALDSYRQAAALVSRTDRAAWFDVHLKLLNVLWRLALYPEARELTGRLLDAFGNWDGSDTRLYSTLIGYDAFLLRQQGKLAEAEARFREVLKMREEVFGAGHPDIVPALNNLAALLRERGEPGEAENHYRRAVEIGEQALRQNKASPAVSLALAKSKNNLASLLETGGKPAEVEALYLSAVELSQNASGPDSPDVGVALGNLAGFFQRQGNPSESKKLYARSLKILEKSLGRDHSDTATVAHSFAGLLRAEGNLTEAGKQFASALAIREKVLGPEHPDTILSVCGLADVRVREKNPAEAEGLYRRALLAREKTPGPNTPAVAVVCNNLAGVLQDEGKAFEAEGLYRRVLAIREKTDGPDSLEAGRALNNLGAVLFELGRFAEAEPLLQRALPIVLRHRETEAALLARVYYWLAINQRALGRDETARATARLAVEAATRAFGPQNARTREAVQLFTDQGS